MTQTLERKTMFSDWKNQYSENDYITQRNLHIQGSPYQATNGIFHRITTKKFYSLFRNTKDYEQPKQLRKKNEAEVIKPSEFRNSVMLQ